MTNRVYGIDLGTTYSCIAYVDDNGTSKVIPNAEGQRTTPSVVYFEDTGDNNVRTVVGETARDEGAFNAHRVVEAVKRQMGDPDWVFDLDGTSYRAEEISSFILRKLVEDAMTIDSQAVTDVVITVPAYFGVNQREATKQAGIIAGLNVRGIIPEPTAAAVAYGMEESVGETVLVYDLGGGTFDVTVIDIQPESLIVICTEGANRLGGKDWDAKVYGWLIAEYENETGAPGAELEDDLEISHALMMQAEKAKRALTTKEQTKIRVQGPEESATLTLTREVFDSLTASELNQTMEYMKAAVETAASLGHPKIDKILLVGGSSLMPQVRASVEAGYPDIAIELKDPNEIVAKGAAAYGQKIAMEQTVKQHIADATGQNVDEVVISEAAPDLVKGAVSKVAIDTGQTADSVSAKVNKIIINVSPKSFGMEIVDNKVSNLVVVNDRLPAIRTRTFYTVAENQQQVNLKIWENMSDLGKDENDPSIDLSECSEVLGEATLAFERALPVQSPIEVTFELNNDGLLEMHGRDLTTNREIRESFQTSSVMNEDELAASIERSKSIDVS